eukprot:scaffold7377_cov389-Prasinococcus_capsulatus_cf.AAC.10
MVLEGCTPKVDELNTRRVWNSPLLGGTHPLRNLGVVRADQEDVLRLQVRMNKAQLVHICA